MYVYCILSEFFVLKWYWCTIYLSRQKVMLIFKCYSHNLIISLAKKIWKLKLCIIKISIIRIIVSHGSSSSLRSQDYIYMYMNVYFPQFSILICNIDVYFSGQDRKLIILKCDNHILIKWRLAKKNKKKIESFNFLD